MKKEAFSPLPGVSFLSNQDYVNEIEGDKDIANLAREFVKAEQDFQSKQNDEFTPYADYLAAHGVKQAALKALITAVGKETGE